MANIKHKPNNRLLFWLLAAVVLLLIKAITLLPVGLMIKVLLGLAIFIGLQIIGFALFYKKLKQRADMAGARKE